MVIEPAVLAKTYTATGLTAGQTYQFKVQAHNAIGYGDASTAFSIIAATNPNTPDAPTTAVNGENIQITWTLPYNGGSAVDGYLIKLKGSDNSFYENVVHCDGINTLTIINTRTCEVPITDLIAAPYNLPWGSSIYANI